jgi:lysophospholipase L1-like esterase
MVAPRQITAADVRLLSIPATQRAPTVTDDATKGFTTSSVWQFDGQVYTPASVNGGAAVWAPVFPRPIALPADILGTAAVGAYGTAAMKAGYTGASIDVTYTKSAASTVATINILPNGQLDRASLYAAIVSRDAGTLARVTKVYDQTGNANHLVAAAAGGPLIGMRSINSFEEISWGSNLGEAGLTIPTTVSLNRQNFSVFMFGSATSATGRTAGSAPLIACELGNTSGGFGVSFQGGTGQVSAGPGSLIAFSSSPSTNNGFSVSIPEGPSVVGFISAAAGLTMTVNERSSTIAALQSNTMTGGNVGRTARVAGAEGMFYPFGIVIANAAATTAQQIAIRQSAYANFNLAPQIQDQIVILGDSRSQGYKTDHGLNWPSQLQQRLSTQYAVDVVDMSVYGLQLLYVDDATQGTVLGAVAQYRPGARNTAIVFAGVNDVSAGRTAAAALVNLQDAVNRLNAVGYRVIVINELRNTANSNAAMDAYRAAFATVTGATVIDPMSVPALTDPTNTAIFPDGLHFSTQGSAIMAAFVEAMAPLNVAA